MLPTTDPSVVAQMFQQYAAQKQQDAQAAAQELEAAQQQALNPILMALFPPGAGVVAMSPQDAGGAMPGPGSVPVMGAPAA